ncbi:helix-turn-helix domain-containing protein [Xenophilus arseniciresistens]|uniref:Helix-turn-helix domain-containing protein n=1 Tax=Xenophilus arseniciresistens TaxID=1283306 RepID=A0AAE3NFI3_9BURK|nr:helix-turn-helix domain-containing protein [Xenophilus arseniciresistens]MDA7418694.1 helix-turn-helix domain-containing protein [Xenophilus arseniciresistens]
MPRPARTESLADHSAAAGGVAAVDRALTLLAAFREGDAALGLAELAQRTRLYKSTALRLLASLEHAGLLHRQPDGRYALGAEIARLHAVYAAAFSLDRVVLPVLQALVRETGESAAYHVRQGQGANAIRVCLFRVDSPHPVRDHIKAGDVLPLSRGTGGRVLSAWDAASQAGASARDKALYAAIRKAGAYCAAGDRLADVAGISVPVFDTHGAVVAAVTLTMPVHRYDAGYLSAVTRAAQALHGRTG